MDITNILSIVLGGGGVLSGLFAWLENRRMAKAQANNSEADYAGKIIDQADKRVAQYEADAERAREDTHTANQYAKEQREAATKWRDRFIEEQTAHHVTQLSLKDTEGLLKEAEWNKCVVNGCAKRIPPRNHEKPA